MRFGLVFSLVLAILAVIFALANPGTMEVDFVLFTTSGSTALVLLLTFGLGIVVGLLSTLPTLLRNRSKLKRLQEDEESETNASSPTTTAGPSSGARRSGGTE